MNCRKHNCRRQRSGSATASAFGTAASPYLPGRGRRRDRTLRELLEHLGYEASTAASGEQAIAAMATVRPHVVFLDVMPGMSSLEVLAHFREHHGAVPVIVITGNMEQEIARQARAGGAFAVVGKPIDLRALKVVVALAMRLAPRT